MRPTSFNPGTPHNVAHNVVLFILEVSLCGLITTQVATWVHHILMDTVNHCRGYDSVFAPRRRYRSPWREQVARTRQSPVPLLWDGKSDDLDSIYCKKH
ncbi:MAG: hypothetical protein KatS3mg056_1084 [Chloroflexus sp.]|jgi:hypothetical protein|nr:MAG: hypothetical protein KatS3mg056_1084 [Chloroflexus sp.]